MPQCHGTDLVKSTESFNSKADNSKQMMLELQFLKSLSENVQFVLMFCSTNVQTDRARALKTK